MDGFAARIPPAVWETLSGFGTSQVYQPGDMLLRQGESADQMLILLRGRVKVSLVDSAGHALLLAIRGPGEALGEVALLDGAVRSATVTAIDSCTVRVIGTEPFQRWLREHKLERELIRGAIHRFRESEELRLELASLPAGDRVVRALLRLAVPAAPEATIVDIGVDQTEFGQAVGLSRGSVAEKLGELRADGVISTHRGRIVVNDLARLRELAVE